MAKRISVINFKGGVGKTTLAFHIATGLARYHSASVLLVDMDHQSSLSIICLGTDGWEDVVKRDATANQIFTGFTSGKMPSENIISQTRLGTIYEKVQIVPASLVLDNTEIELTASAQGNAIKSEWNKRTLICRWLEETKINAKYDYIVFDCAPATKIISQNAIAASHGYVIPVVPESVMERGAPHLQQMIKNGIDVRLREYATLGDPRCIFVPTTKLIGLAVTRVQVAGNAVSGYTDDHTQHLTSLKSYWGDRLLEPYIPLGTGVSSALTRRTPVYDSSDWQNIKRRRIDRKYKELTEKLKSRIDEL